MKKIPNALWYLCGILCATCIVVWIAVLHYDARFHTTRLHVFSVGQGDGMLIETPGGHDIVVDGGPDQTILSKLGRTLLPWERSLDLVVLTHPHADHVDGLIDVAERYRIGAVVESGAVYDTPDYRRWHELLAQKHIPVFIAHAGERIEEPDGFSLGVAAPLGDVSGRRFSNIHDAMVVMRLTYGNAAAMLMGDAEQNLEDELMRAYPNLHADLLKVGHHGSKTSTSDDFLRAVAPVYAVISVGARNRYGLPNADVVNRLTDAGIRVFRTDTDGDMLFVSNGASFVPVAGPW